MVLLAAPMGTTDDVETPIPVGRFDQTSLVSRLPSVATLFVNQLGWVQPSVDANAKSMEIGFDRVVDERPHSSRMHRAVSEIGRQLAPPFFLGVVLVMIVASAIGLLLTHVFEHSALVRLDIRIDKALEANRTPRLTHLTGVGTFFADPLPVATALFLAVVITSLAVRRWRPPFFLMFAVGGEKLSYYLTTLIVGRPRPPVQTVGQVHVTSSYPSGHVGSAISLWASVALLLMTLIAGRLRPRAVVVTFIVGLFFAAEVGYSRLYRGHHFLTDVLVGAAIGTVWVILAYRVVLAPYLNEKASKAS